jgi:hypothetical protein
MGYLVGQQAGLQVNVRDSRMLPAASIGDVHRGLLRLTEICLVHSQLLSLPA